MSTHEIDARLAFALSASKEAAAITLRYFGQQGLAVENKADASPVTIADRSAEEFLRIEIAKAFPNDAVLGEEYGEQPGTSGYRWILDPIDGTKSFIFGVPLYAMLVGVEREGRGVLGVIRIPALDECAYAARGSGAWHVRGNNAPQLARVSSVDRFKDGLFVTSEVETFAKVDALDAYLRLGKAARVSRTWGDGYGYLLVATGRALAMVDPKMSVWDAAAVQPVVEEAGGTFTDWHGRPTIHSGEGIATNGLVFDEVLALVKG